MKNKNRVRASAEQPMVTNDPRVALELNNDGLIKALDACCPVCVYSYDREKHTAKVMPLVKQAFFKTKWEYINAQTFEVRVRSIQCGGFCVDIPLFVGDTGWVFASDRDMTFLRAEDSETVKVLYKDCTKQKVEDELTKEPMRPILHSLQDGFFIPDNWGKWDYLKFKDADNLPLPTSMYIGTSLHENYEAKPSCSVSFGRDGKLHLMASTKKVFDIGRAHVELTGERLTATVDRSDKRESRTKKFTLDYRDGATLEVNTDSASRNVVKVNDDGIRLNIFSSERGNPTELFMAKDGKISIITDSDVYLKGREVKADCEKISVVGKVEVTGDGVTVKSKDVEVASAENVIVQSGRNVEVNAGASVQVVSGGDCRVECDSTCRIKGEYVDVVSSTVAITATNKARINGNTIEMLGSTIDIKGGSLKLNGRQIMAGSDIIDALQN